MELLITDILEYLNVKFDSDEEKFANDSLVTKSLKIRAWTAKNLHISCEFFNSYITYFSRVSSRRRNHVCVLSADLRLIPIGEPRNTLLTTCKTKTREKLVVKMFGIEVARGSHLIFESYSKYTLSNPYCSKLVSFHW